MKKKLNTDAIKNELVGSVFFPSRTNEKTQPEQLSDAAPSNGLPPPQQERKTQEDSMLSSKQDSMQASNHASTLAFSTESIESIRKVVKNPGKEEVLYVRLTKEE